MNRLFQLPPEIVEEILLRVPADSLRICERVCKWWFCLIKSPSFVNKHLFRVTSKTSKFPKTIFLKWVRQELSLEDIFSPVQSYLNHGHDPSKVVLSLITIDDDNKSKTDLFPCVVESVTLPPVPLEEQERFPIFFPATL